MQRGAIEKICPIVLRAKHGAPDILSFQHPVAGKQFVKGTIQRGEAPITAAYHELYEESGIVAVGDLLPLGACKIGQPPLRWHFFVWRASELPNAWQYQTLDDYGHMFSFFWHPLSQPLDAAWHSNFHEAHAYIAPLIRKRLCSGSV